MTITPTSIEDTAAAASGAFELYYRALAAALRPPRWVPPVRRSRPWPPRSSRPPKTATCALTTRMVLAEAGVALTATDRYRLAWGR
ncbi:hypothetical protein [Ornithinimicrobium murale]|uniref:hypothetical protein n=1 Tax=Ornithinimicrobium murale TaxID=1050153 RepID=UPI000E0D60AD|nr:hypothetical protein [Ornithinimicrobium murale]